MDACEEEETETQETEEKKEEKEKPRAKRTAWRRMLASKLVHLLLKGNAAFSTQCLGLKQKGGTPSGLSVLSAPLAPLAESV